MNPDQLDTMCKAWFEDIKKSPSHGVCAAKDVQVITDIIRTLIGLQRQSTGFILAHSERQDPTAFTLKEWTLGDYGNAVPSDSVPTVDVQITRILDSRERLTERAIVLYKLSVKLATKCIVPDRVMAQLKMAHIHLIEDMGVATTLGGASHLYLWIRSHNIGITAGYNVTAFFEKTRVVPCVTSDRVSISDGFATLKNMFVGIVSKLKPAPRAHPLDDEDSDDDDTLSFPNPKKRKHDTVN